MPKIAHPSPVPRDPQEPYPVDENGNYVFDITLRITADPAFLGEGLRLDELNAKVLESIGYSPFLADVDVVGN